MNTFNNDIQNKVIKLNADLTVDLSGTSLPATTPFNELIQMMAEKLYPNVLLYIFEPNVGIHGTYNTNAYATVNATAQSLACSYTTGGQFASVCFSIDLSNYIGSNKKIRMKYKTTGTPSFHELNANKTTSVTASDRRTINFAVSDEVITVDFNIDDFMTSQYKYLGVGYSDTTLMIYELSIV